MLQENASPNEHYMDGRMRMHTPRTHPWPNPQTHMNAFNSYPVVTGLNCSQASVVLASWQLANKKYMQPDSFHTSQSKASHNITP